MSKRSYAQLCPIAHALDLVGERWTLLVVRELLLGPKRFSDLHAGLPGIGTNILSARLKELEAASVVSRRLLAPPAASWVYELTSRGRELGGIVLRLGRWGITAPGFGDSDAAARPEWTVLSLYARYSPSAAAAAPASVELRLGDETYCARINEGQLTIDRGAATGPELIVSLDHDALIRIIHGIGRGRDRPGSGVTIIEGSQAAFEGFLRLFT
jgi:DNA-binding HxlR family transcriptional regulator